MTKTALRLGVALALLLLASPPAEAKSVPHLRVIVPKAAVRSGPGFTYRELYRAERGEVMRVVERNGTYWFRVVMPDGRFGWLYGEQVIPFEVSLDGKSASARWLRFKEAVFSPSPIPAASVSFTFSGGALGGDGMFMFRPAVIANTYLAIEGHLGQAVGSEGSLLLYGIGGDILVWPAGPIVPFVSLGVGGGTAFPKVNGVTQTPKSQFAVDAGAGLMAILRKRIILRFDFRNYTLFTANSTVNLQEYSGGLAVYF